MSLLNIQRAAELLGDIGALFDHPGVADQGRKALAEEVLEVIQIDEHGIRAVLPAEIYRSLIAIAEAGGGGGGAGDGTRTRDLLLGKQTLYQLSYSRDYPPALRRTPSLQRPTPRLVDANLARRTRRAWPSAHVEPCTFSGTISTANRHHSKNRRASSFTRCAHRSNNPATRIFASLSRNTPERDVCLPFR